MPGMRPQRLWQRSPMLAAIRRTWMDARHDLHHARQSLRARSQRRVLGECGALVAVLVIVLAVVPSSPWVDPAVRALGLPDNAVIIRSEMRSQELPIAGSGCSIRPIAVAVTVDESMHRLDWLPDGLLQRWAGVVGAPPPDCSFNVWLLVEGHPIAVRAALRPGSLGDWSVPFEIRLPGETEPLPSRQVRVLCQARDDVPQDHTTADLNCGPEDRATMLVDYHAWSVRPPRDILQPGRCEVRLVWSGPDLVEQRGGQGNPTDAARVRMEPINGGYSVVAPAPGGPPVTILSWVAVAEPVASFTVPVIENRPVFFHEDGRPMDPIPVSILSVVVWY